jgi:hypothetical protein
MTQLGDIVYTCIHMILTFHTQHFFKMQAGDTILALNPVNTATSKKVNKFGSDIAMSTYFDGDMEIFETATYGDKEPIALYGPGSYEVDGLQITGYDIPLEGEHHTLYTFTFDDIRVAVLGTIDQKSALTPEAMEALDNRDIIFVPATDSGFELATKFTPRVIVPTGYNDVSEIKDFLDTLSSEQMMQVNKLTLKFKDIEALQSFAYVFTA